MHIKIHFLIVKHYSGRSRISRMTPNLLSLKGRGVYQPNILAIISQKLHGIEIELDLESALPDLMSNVFTMPSLR